MENGEPLVSSIITTEPIAVQFKGIREGLLVTLSGGEFADIEAALLKHIEENQNFFEGAKVALDVGNTVIHAAELGSLRDKLSERGISLWALLSFSPVTEQTALMYGFATRLSSQIQGKKIRPIETNISGDQAMWVQRTLRSGFELIYDGHIVIIGDVNPGAKVIAGGSVVVWGRLRGLVHAGAHGDSTAIICAMELSPTQMRIADFVYNKQKKKPELQPEMASVVDEQVVTEIWNFKEGSK